MKGLALLMGLALAAVGCQRGEVDAQNTLGGPGAMPPNPNGMAKPGAKIGQLDLAGKSEDKPDKEKPGKPDKLGLVGKSEDKPKEPVKPDKLGLVGSKVGIGGVNIKGTNVAAGAGPISNTGLNGSQGASPGAMPPKP